MSKNPAVVNSKNTKDLTSSEEARLALVKKIEEAAEKEGSSEPKKSQGEIYRSLSKALNRDPKAEFEGPKFNIGVYLLDEFKRQPFIERGDGSIKPVDLQDLEPMIYYYSESLATHHSRYILTAEQTASAAKVWQLTAEPIPKPKYLAFKNDPSPALRKLDFDLPEIANWKDAPNVTGIFQRIIRNEKQLRAAVWSMVISPSSAPQYIWMMGKGGDGKGSLMRFLIRLFGEANVASQTNPPWEGFNKHWAAPLLNKRLLLIPDLKCDTDLDNAVLKSLTGGDHVMIDRKNKDAFSGKLDCHVVVGSNDRPNLGDGRADRRRIIYVPFEPRDPNVSLMDQREFDDLLWSEAPVFLALCKKAYEELCPNGGVIPVDPESLEILDEELEEREIDMQMVFNRFFFRDPKGSIRPVEVIATVQNYKHYSAEFFLRFKKWLERHFEIKRCSDNSRTWRGFARKPENNFTQTPF